MKSATQSTFLRCCTSGAPLSSASVKDQIIDFLDGKSQGECLLHALYDHILDEPIPERMRFLFKK
jgi:hypothetical protein